MKCKIGDILIIKSKIVSGDSESGLLVKTSCPSGWDIFVKTRCNIDYGYVFHEVKVVGIVTEETEEYGRKIYRVKNLDVALSVNGDCAWQDCSDYDILCKVNGNFNIIRILTNKFKSGILKKTQKALLK